MRGKDQGVQRGYGVQSLMLQKEDENSAPPRVHLVKHFTANDCFLDCLFFHTRKARTKTKAKRMTRLISLSCVSSLNLSCLHVCM